MVRGKPLKTKMNRRSFVSGAALGASSILGGALNKVMAAGSKDASAQGPVANTTAGKIRGTVQENKVHAFRGIPYGAPTGGANRFMPPVKPEAWTGIKETIEWGPEESERSPARDDIRADQTATVARRDRFDVGRMPARRHQIAVAHEVERIGQSQKRSERQPDNTVRLFEFTLFQKTNFDGLIRRHEKSAQYSRLPELPRMEGVEWSGENH